MKLFKKSTMSVALSAAVAGGALMGLSAPVQAVNLAQDGLGETLVFPYYTVRDNWASLFNITNTSNKTVVAKVRWREGVNSRDVRDFNIVLSPYDVWTASTRIGANGGAEMITADSSCTLPELPSRGTNSEGKALTGIGFTNTAYTLVNGTDNRDGGSESLARTNEGYFEVVSMGSIDNATATGHALEIANNAKHLLVSGNTATPGNCARVRTALRDIPATKLALDPPENVLKGRAALIKAVDGIAAGYDPMTLANFSSTEIYFAPEASQPDLNSGDPEAVVINDDTALATTLNPISTPAVTTGADAVSALILRSAVINDYNVKGDSETDWVLTFPTKNFYVDRALSATATFASIPFGGLAPLAPFDATVNGEAFSANQAGKSCFDVRVDLWDREEFDTPPTTTTDEFSPSEPGSPPGRNQLCYEANVLSFGDSNIFGSSLQKSLFAGNEAGLPGLSGWAQLGFGQAGDQALPVIGMRMEVRKRANEANKNFGIANNHAYKR